MVAVNPNNCHGPTREAPGSQRGLSRFGRPSLSQGFALIAAIILIVVAAVMAAVMATLVASSSQSGGIHISSAQALFIAESGLEKAIYERSLSNTYLGEGPTAMGQGSYTITVYSTDFSGTPLPSGQQRLRSVGQTDTATRTVEVIVRTGGAMMVYAKDSPGASQGIPYFRQWNNDTYTWGPEQQANDVGPIIRYLVLKFARTRDEAILGTMNSSGQIHVQVWDGTTWGPIRLLSTVGGGSSQYRGFDIEYETRGDRAIVVFNNGNNRNPAYQVWDGTSWSATVGLNVSLGGNYDSTNNAPRWIELAPNPLPTSNEIALMTLDAGSDVYGVRWNGTAWARMSAATLWENSASTNSRKAMDVAYEQLTGRALFIWGDNFNDRQRWRIWTSSTSTLSGASNLFINAMNQRAYWVRLVPRPNSNQLMYVVQDNGRDLNSALWNGAGFAVHPEHDSSTEDANSRNFDFVFDTHPTRAGRGWLLWGNGGNVSTREWNGGGWNGIANLAGSDDTSYIRLLAHPASGVVFAGLYEDSTSGGPTQDDIYDVHLTQGGTAWSPLAMLWNGGTVNDPVQQRVDIAAERYKPILAWREVFP